MTKPGWPITTPNGPDGLAALTTNSETVDAFDGTLDIWLDAISICELHGVAVADLAFVAHPTDVLTMMKLKTLDTGNEPLLAADAMSPTQRSIFGVPLYSSIACEQGIAWAIPKSKTFVVIRSNATVVFDSSPLFTSDRWAAKLTLRASFAFPAPGAICRIAIDGAS